MPPSTVLLPPHPKGANQALRAPGYVPFNGRSNQFGTLVAERFGRLRTSRYVLIDAGSTGQARFRRSGRWNDAPEMYFTRRSCCLGDTQVLMPRRVQRLRLAPRDRLVTVRSNARWYIRLLERPMIEIIT